MVHNDKTQLTGRFGGNEKRYFCIIQSTNSMDQTNLLGGICWRIQRLEDPSNHPQRDL